MGIGHGNEIETELIVRRHNARRSGLRLLELQCSGFVVNFKIQMWSKASEEYYVAA